MHMPTRTQALLTASVAVAMVLAGCAGDGRAADVGAGDTDTTPSADLPWSWTDTVTVRAQSYVSVPFDAGSTSTMTASARVTDGPPIDVWFMTRDHFLRMQRDDGQETIPACSAHGVAEWDMPSPGCTLEPGSYVILLRNDSPYSVDDAPAADAGPATVDVEFTLAPQAAAQTP